MILTMHRLRYPQAEPGTQSITRGFDRRNLVSASSKLRTPKERQQERREVEFRYLLDQGSIQLPRLGPCKLCQGGQLEQEIGVQFDLLRGDPYSRNFGFGVLKSNLLVAWNELRNLKRLSFSLIVNFCSSVYSSV